MLDPNNQSDQLAVRIHVLKNLGESPANLEFEIAQCDGDEASLKSIRSKFWAWFEDAFEKNGDRIVKGLRGAGFAGVVVQDLEWELHTDAWNARLLGMFMDGVLYQ